MPINKFCIPIVLFLLFTWSTFAQSADNEFVKIYEQTEKSLVLLKNERDLLPLKRLDTLRIAYLPIEMDAYDADEIEQTLQKYTSVTTLELPRNALAKDVAAWVEDALGKYDLFILGINDLSSDATPAFLTYQRAMLPFIESGKTVSIILGGKRALEYLPELANSDGLIVAPKRIDWAQSLAAQIVFGGIGASGTLEQDFNAAFTSGFGLTTEKTRLGYAPAATVGFDAQKLRTGIDSIVRQGLDSMAYPGAQVLVAKGGKIVYHETFGFHTYAKAIPVKQDDVYDFASITKVSASLPAVMKLYGEGKFDIDKTLGEYYPPFQNSNKADFTFRRMLTHTSGLMAWIPFWRGTMRGSAKYPWRKRWDGTSDNVGNYKWRTFQQDSSGRYNVLVTDDMWLHRRYKNQIIKSIRKSPIKPEQGYVYSDLHFYLYPEIIPRITDLEFETYLKQNFYEPLGANTLTFNPWRFYPDDRIIPTERDTFFRRALLHGRVHDEGAAMLSGVSGHAGLFGTPNDLAKLMQMYLNGGTYGGERYIQQEVLDEFTACAYCDEGVHRGIGFDKPLIEYDPVRSSVAKSASPESFGHSGYTGTFTWVDPKQDLIYIFFCNRVHPSRDSRKIYTLNIRPRVHQAIYDAMKE